VRVLKSNYADRALELGFATGDDLARISAGWHIRAADRDGWFAPVHGEILCRISK